MSQPMHDNRSPGTLTASSSEMVIFRIDQNYF